MAPLKKPRNPTKLPLALNPTKSKDILAVLAERNQAIIPVGAWVEPASSNCSEIPAHTLAYIIQEEIKEQQRRKQESLKHFQRQVKHRVNQQVKLRKKQQLQKSYKAAEKECSIAMSCSDLAHLTPKRTSVFPSNLNAAIGSFIPISEVCGDATEEGENQNQLFQQQAQALSQTMKQARHQLASFKTVSEKKTSVFLNGRYKSSPTQEDIDCEEISSVVTCEERENYFMDYQRDLLSEGKEKVQKVKFKNPLFVVIKEEEQNHLNLRNLQAVLPEAQDYLVEVQGSLSESQREALDVQNVEPKASRIEPTALGVEPDVQAPGVAVRTELQDVLRAQTANIAGNPELEAQGFLPLHQTFLSRDQDFLLSCHDQDMFLKQPSASRRGERQDEKLPLECHQYAPPHIQDGVFLREQSLHFKQQPSVRTAEGWREDLHLGGHECLPPRQPRDTCSRRQQVNEASPWGVSTEHHTVLAFHSGVDQEEDKKERQKQYLRHRRLFMDIEREQVKEQNRQREQKKRMEKIKKRKEQQRYAEEQRLLRMSCHEEPYSEEKISDVLAQLQLEEIKGAREKQQQREKEYVRYVEALRAQVQEKMKLYNITLPPLCCCGPDFWDAHPDTCANNCIFYKNYRAYNRALHSVINSSDISEGNAILRNAIRNFASAHRRTAKKVSNKTLKSVPVTELKNVSKMLHHIENHKTS